MVKSVKSQRYLVPTDKYRQDLVSAKFRNAILTVTIPPKEESVNNEEMKVDIVSEDETSSEENDK